MEHDARLVVQLPSALKERIAEEAEKRNVSASKVVRDAIVLVLHMAATGDEFVSLSSVRSYMRSHVRRACADVLHKATGRPWMVECVETDSEGGYTVNFAPVEGDGFETETETDWPLQRANVLH